MAKRDTWTCWQHVPPDVARQVITDMEELANVAGKNGHEAEPGTKDERFSYDTETAIRLLILELRDSYLDEPEDK